MIFNLHRHLIIFIIIIKFILTFLDILNFFIYESFSLFPLVLSIKIEKYFGYQPLFHSFLIENILFNFSKALLHILKLVFTHNLH